MEIQSAAAGFSQEASMMRNVGIAAFCLIRIAAAIEKAFGSEHYGSLSIVARPRRKRMRMTRY
jgi:hypothetical protein